MQHYPGARNHTAHTASNARSANSSGQVRPVHAVCAGDESVGAAAGKAAGTRFGFLKAPRSTVLQPGPVHGGMTHDPGRQLEHLLERFVG